ncbi:MAG: signal peptidase II [Patescibacteria group bacterium]
MPVLLITTTVALLLSYLTRLLVESSLHARRPILGDFFALQFVENRGIAFGITFHPILQGLLVAFALIFVCFLAYKQRREFLPNIAFGMILGGALANIFDRLDDGLVTDFISVGTFPTFNGADSFITIGVLLLLGSEFWRKRASAGQY